MRCVGEFVVGMGEQRFITAGEPSLLFTAEFGAALGHRTVDHMFDMAQEVTHVGGPRVVALVGDKGQFAQVMSIA